VPLLLVNSLECPQGPTKPTHNSLNQVKTSEFELDEAKVEEREYGEFDASQEEPENIEAIVAEMSALECTYEGWGEPHSRPGP
jgi:hypothetical protein